MNVQFLGSFPTWGASSTKQLALAGITPSHEVHYLVISCEGNYASTSTAFTGNSADINAIGAALFSKFRMTYNGITDAVNLTPAELRTVDIAFMGRDPAGYFMPAPAVNSVPASGSPAAVKIEYFIPFVHRGLDTPSLFSPSSDQLNIPGNHLDFDAGAGGNITLTGGTATFAVTDIKLYAVIQRSPAPYIAPTVLMRSKSIAQSIDTEQGQAIDLFVADERTPATTEVQVSQISIVRDGVYGPRNVTPKHLAMLYSVTAPPQDGVAPVDITSATNGLGTQAGSQVTPIIWVGAHNRASETEVGYWLDHRQIQQNLASGGSASATYLFCQVRTVDQAESFGLALMSQYGVQGSLRQLPVRGGGGADNSVNAAFKGRFVTK